MRSRRLSVFALALTLGAHGPLVAGCASVPAACEPLCAESSAAPCQQCLEQERAKQEEARRKREEARRQAPPAPSPSMRGGGVPSGY
jgi:hypothetical protein